MRRALFAEIGCDELALPAAFEAASAYAVRAAAGAGVRR
jgi:hypothetical protein